MAIHKEINIIDKWEKDDVRLLQYLRHCCYGDANARSCYISLHFSPLLCDRRDSTLLLSHNTHTCTPPLSQSSSVHSSADIQPMLTTSLTGPVGPSGPAPIVPAGLTCVTLFQPPPEEVRQYNFVAINGFNQ